MISLDQLNAAAKENPAKQAEYDRNWVTHVINNIDCSILENAEKLLKGETVDFGVYLKTANYSYYSSNLFDLVKFYYQPLFKVYLNSMMICYVTLNQ